MPVIDPKQMLLKHVEKLALLLALGWLAWVVYTYPPWEMKVDVEDRISRALDRIEQKEKTIYTYDPGLARDNAKLVVADGLGPVPDYLEAIRREISNPMGVPLKRYDGTLVFSPGKAGPVMIHQQVAPPPPLVLPPSMVYAEADKGRAIVIFFIDQQAQRLEVEKAHRAYLNGLEFQSIEIIRRDLATQNEVTVTPPNWVPTGLPRIYGPPRGWTFQPAPGAEPPAGPASWNSGLPATTYGQREEPDPESGLKRDEEELRRAQERATGAPTTAGPGPSTPGVRAPLRPPVAGAHDPGLAFMSSIPVPFHFVDETVETEGEYEYRVVLTVKHPLHGNEHYRNSDKLPRILTSQKSAATPVVRIESFKRWYFTGGAPDSEQAFCKVWMLTGSEGGPDEAAIRRMVSKVTGAPVTPPVAPGRARGSVPEQPAADSQGEWVSANFRVLPGEEIGMKREVTLTSGEKRTIDFSTGVFVISMTEDVQVIEEERTRHDRVEGGELVKVNVVARNVRPRLKLTVLDRKGKVSSRWVETSPATPGAPSVTTGTTGQ